MEDISLESSSVESVELHPVTVNGVLVELCVSNCAPTVADFARLLIAHPLQLPVDEHDQSKLECNPKKLLSSRRTMCIQSLQICLLRYS